MAAINLQTSCSSHTNYVASVRITPINVKNADRPQWMTEPAGSVSDLSFNLTMEDFTIEGEAIQ